MIIVLGLMIGAGVGAVAFLSGALNLPLSIAVCFLVASTINVLSMGRSR